MLILSLPSWQEMQTWLGRWGQSTASAAQEFSNTLTVPINAASAATVAPSSMTAPVAPESTPPRLLPLKAVLAANPPALGNRPTLPAPTVTPLSPVALSSASASNVYVLGYLQNRPECQLATEIVAAFLTQQEAVEISTRGFDSAEALYASLTRYGPAESKSDLTLCYRYPEDNLYLSGVNEQVAVIGKAYVHDEQTQWHAVVSAERLRDLQLLYPCLYTFLNQQLTFADWPPSGTDAQSWLVAHADQVAQWQLCANPTY
jgi:hypothetical protein